MKAVLTLKGNEVEGYVVSLSIPRTFIECFDARMKHYLFGSPLCEHWGEYLDGHSRQIEFWFCNLQEAEGQVVKIQNELTDVFKRMSVKKDWSFVITLPSFPNEDETVSD